MRFRILNQVVVISLIGISVSSFAFGGGNDSVATAASAASAASAAAASAASATSPKEPKPGIPHRLNSLITHDGPYNILAKTLAFIPPGQAFLRFSELNPSRICPTTDTSQAAKTNWTLSALGTARRIIPLRPGHHFHPEAEFEIAWPNQGERTYTVVEAFKRGKNFILSKPAPVKMKDLKKGAEYCKSIGGRLPEREELGAIGVALGYGVKDARQVLGKGFKRMMGRDATGFGAVLEIFEHSSAAEPFVMVGSGFDPYEDHEVRCVLPYTSSDPVPPAPGSSLRSSIGTNCNKSFTFSAAQNLSANSAKR